jgi:hypothetical protein
VRPNTKPPAAAAINAATVALMSAAPFISAP